MKNPNACPKYEGQMVQGFIPDFARNGAYVGCWHEGKPQKSFWTGTKITASAALPIGAFRCQNCGYLEFYANPEFNPQ